MIFNHNQHGTLDKCLYFIVLSQEPLLTGMTASLKFINMIGHLSSKHFPLKIQFYSQKHAYHAQLEALSYVKNDNENVRHYALKVEILVKQGWYNEYPSTINLKCNEIFTRGLPKNLKSFANKRQVKHISSSLEPYIPSHSLVNMVDSEDIGLEKLKTHEFALNNNTLFDTFQQDISIQKTSPESLQIQARDPNSQSKPQYKKYCSFCQKNNLSVSTFYRRLNMLKPSKSPTPSFCQHFKTPSNKHYPQNPQIRSRSSSNSYRRFSCDFRYKSRSHSSLNSRSQYPDKTYPHKPSSYYDRNISRYDQY